MIAFLKGKIIKKNTNSIIILNQGIGYELRLSKDFISRISQDDNIELFIHSHIREDCFDLYGFEKFEELEFFKLLLSVSGIGPKVGLEILSVKPEKIKSAIATADFAFLAKIPGIGKKTAERIVLELKSKISIDSLQRTHSSLSNEISEDIINALENLGFSKNEILKTLEKLPKNLKKEQEIISYFLKNN